MHARHCALVILGSFLSACAMGPEFQRPAAPDTGRYTPGEQPATTAAATGEAGEAQRFVGGASLPGRWWESFQCEALNALVGQALAHSPTVLEARARLRQAQADLSAQARGTLYPGVDAQLGVTRQKVDPAAFGIPNVPSAPPFTLYNAQVNVSYTLDLFGANRRLLESLRAQSEYQSYETEAAELTLAANVVAAAIRQADLEAQLDYTRQLLAAESRQVAISEERYQAGGIALADLENRRSQLAQLRAALPVLEAERQQIDHQLAVYTGKPPSEAATARFRLSDLRLPTELPVTLPAELVRRRPDVRASEALWHAAGANVGVATANLLPSLTLAGNAGSDATSASTFADSFNVWSIGARVLQPIFRAGELRAKRRAAQAAYDAAAQAYEQTVLVSLQQVADCLRILEGDALALQARAAASEQSAGSYGVARQRFDAGGISEYSLLDAQRLQLQTALERSHAAALRLTDTAALLHALAGSA
ncbi:MAG TPA: efflux transporter outer membrane subunit [Steroidobacteraceae bacterium]|nr:efflux transporter outer membrane subunit [Steroidobacteraceae bacterium]